MTVSLSATRLSVSTLALTAMLAFTAPPTLAQAQSSHVIILPDASSSYRGAVDEAFARRVAGDVVDRMPELPMRSKVTIQPLGEYGARNAVREAVVSRRFPAQAAMQSITGMIAGFPAMVSRDGTQQATNILGTLDQVARRMDCAAQDGHVFVLSDGIETGQSMTLPRSPVFEGCASFTIIGVMGQTPAQTQELGDFWMRWCAQAGFSRCDWLS
ncbi:MAG: hypothetical protein AAF234_11500 [Pseudomonadota bacterium]